MSLKLEVAICLLLTLLPFWIALVVVDLTRKSVAVGVLVMLAAAGCFLIGGLQASLAMIGAAYAISAAWGLPKAVVARRRRARLVESSHPERVDLERWARRALRKQGWTVEIKPGPFRLIVSQTGFTTFHVFCVPSYRTIGSSDLRNLGHYASRTNAPVILLLFGGAPATLVDALRGRQLLPVSQRDFLGHVASASSRADFVKSCRAAVIEEVAPHPVLYPQAAFSMA